MTTSRKRKARPKDPKKKPPRKKPGQYAKENPVLKASVRRLLDEVVSEDPERIKRTIRKHFSRGGNVGFKFVELAAAYIDGRPKVTIELEPPQDIHFHFHKPKEEEETSQRLKGE